MEHYYLITWRQKFYMERDGEGNPYQISKLTQTFKGKYPCRAIQRWTRLWNLKESDCTEFNIKKLNNEWDLS